MFIFFLGIVRSVKVFVKLFQFLLSPASFINRFLPLCFYLHLPLIFFPLAPNAVSDN